MSENNRLHYLDLARGAGIILVILGHISYLGEGSRIFIVSFHMPLFFVISGLLIFLKKEDGRPLSHSLKNKALRMMVPYYLYSVLGILIYIVYYLLTGRDGGWPTVISDLVQTLTLYGFSVMWFLPAIFGAELLFLRLLKKTPFPLILTVLLTAAAMILNGCLEEANALYGLDTAFSVFHLIAVMLLRIPVCASFIAAGYYIAKYWSKLKATGPDRFPRLAVPADLLIGADALGLAVVFSRINGVTDLHFLIFNNVLFYYIAALSGSMGLILICKAFETAAGAPPLRLLSYFGINSLTIMVTHLNFYVLLLAEIGGFHFTKALPEGMLKHNVFMLLVLIFTLCGEIVTIEALKRLSQMNFSMKLSRFFRG